MSSTTKSRLLLLAVVLIWGASFALVKAALNDASPLLFNLLRMTLAALILALVHRKALRGLSRRTWQAGAIAGLFLALGYQFQTFGLARTTPAKSAFITGLVVVLVPLLTFLPILRPPASPRPALKALAGAILAFAGLLLLTTPPHTAARELFASISSGDLITLACAFAFAFHLLTLARVSPGIPAGTLATLQIGFAAVVMLFTVPLEPARLHLTVTLAIAFFLTAILGTAVAFTVQSYAQQHLPPTQTAVLLTLEPVFAWLTSLVLFHERLGSRGLLGAVLILVAIALIELLPTGPQPTEVPA